MSTITLQAFTMPEFKLAQELLAAKVASMIGRKMEEGDWDFVYCNAKKIPLTSWSNLNIDINFNGIGVEHKMSRVAKFGSILGECGTTKMHPAGTRSIRIPDERDPNKAMKDILEQYGSLIDIRTAAVKKNSSNNTADMRLGWLIWKDSLDEFLYFEERMLKPNPLEFYATWNVTPARGARKESKSLWIFEKASNKKKYSVTTEAGAKIQPYFDVPPPTDPNLYYFRVQGIVVDKGLVKVWLTKSTARYLELLVGDLNSDSVSKAIIDFNGRANNPDTKFIEALDIATPIEITQEAYRKLQAIYDPISDEYMIQQFAIDLGSLK